MNRKPIKLKLASESFNIRCEFGHVQSIEAVADMGLVAIAKRAQAGELRLNQTTEIIRECLRLNGYEFDDPEWHDLCLRAGILQLASAVNVITLSFFAQPESPKVSRKKADPGNAEAADTSH